ncbi:hypothetical protein [Lactobacillus delbrueckii]|uniref:hypothetical protein n=1 Tax=Lactobacillus delbrueckii TaxID=1584 RepID=UPI001E488360|nr:hypothetical protein [Lactobacillus delbrueckii]MCD5439818.1 hypothetical protein [Lactobacillus delbrueckii subsp. lactis]
MKFDINMTDNYISYRGKQLDKTQKAVIGYAQKTALQLYDLAMKQDEDKIKEYLSDYLDITFMIGKDRDLEGLRVWLMLGGPGLYVDTFNQTIVCNWNGSEEASCFLPMEVCTYIEDTFGVSEYNKINE